MDSNARTRSRWKSLADMLDQFECGRTQAGVNEFFKGERSWFVILMTAGVPVTPERLMPLRLIHLSSATHGDPSNGLV
jgi:hypothetical protein